MSADQQTAATPFPIVGIGASAGGLAAFEAFFSAMPADTEPGVAFVLVQHLAPDHKSMLRELISRYSRMEVFEVEDGVQVRPNCAYIIPPNRDMAFVDGALRLIEPAAPRGRRLPIDFFFRSLAQALHERAICIVLSGTGSDGTEGLRTIKSEGGMAMVQSADSAEHDGMPRSALATGLVDYELPPAEMPAQLLSYVAHAYHEPTQQRPAVVEESGDALHKLCVLLRAQTGHDFSRYKPSTLQRRIERRVAVRQLASLDEYVAYVQRTPDELDVLFRDLLIGVTAFFRDPEAFAALEELVIPQLFAGKPAGAAVRVWCTGCSSGEEAYSIAILLQERMEALKQTYKAQIFATDIDARTIVTARAGRYSSNIASDVSAVRLSRFFTAEPDGSGYRVHKSIRDMVVFSEQDVIKDPPFSRMDLISCRNLLIYMGAELQQKLLPLFQYALNPGGFLFLGTSESVGESAECFDVVERKWKLFRRRDLPARRAVPRFLPPAALHDATRSAGPTPSSKKTSLREMTEQALLLEIAPAAALVNRAGDILYLHGRTGSYLEPAPGEAGPNNIVKMAREGLEPDLRAALRTADAEKRVVRHAGLRVKTNGDFTRVDLTVRPVVSGPAAASSESPLYLVVLEEAAESPAELQPAPATSPAEASGDAESRIAALKEQLRAKEEYLQSTAREREIANEELRSANEEMQSINEELQSTNEELETSKEELQSVNEELATVNAELETKVTDLSRVNNDMNNLLAGTNIGTVFVDHQLRILRFTPAITQIIHLIAADVGRPVGHIVSDLVGYDALVKDTQAVLDTLIPKEIEVQTREGTRYAMRILPYRTLENVIEGAVITFVDITKMKRAEEALLESERKYRTLVAHAADAVVVSHSDKIVLVNQACVTLCGAADEAALLGRPIYEIFDPDSRAVLEAATQRLRDQTDPVASLNAKIKRPDGTAIDVEVVATCFLHGDASDVHIILRTARRA